MSVEVKISHGNVKKINGRKHFRGFRVGTYRLSKQEHYWKNSETVYQSLYQNFNVIIDATRLYLKVVETQYKKINVSYRVIVC